MIFCSRVGVSATLVSGPRPLDEIKVGLVAGLVSGAALLFSGTYLTMGMFNLWTFGVALPALAAGTAARYSVSAQRQWTTFWAEKEQAA